MVKDIVLKGRSYRRFFEEKRIHSEELKELADVGHYTASGGNNQPLRYKLVSDTTDCEKVYQCLKWAGYLTDWDGPKEGERPSAYIIMATEDGAKAPYDEGIAAQAIMMAAVEKGMGGCFLLNVDRDKLKSLLNMDDKYSVGLVIALGYPKEEVVIEEINKGEDIKYYRDSNQVHHVPKIKLSDLII